MLFVTGLLTGVVLIFTVLGGLGYHESQKEQERKTLEQKKEYKNDR